MKERKKRLAPGLIALVIFLMNACLCSCSDSMGTEDGNTIQNETERVEQEKADSDGSETAKKEETDPDGSETAKKEETDPDGAETRKKEEADPDGRKNETEEETTNNKAEGEGEESPDSTETEMPDISGVTSVTYHEGGDALSDVLSGVTRVSVLDWLGLHREDDYYLGTPYPAQEDGTLIGGACGSTDRRNPNGDCAS
ncbi:MAG: hypothetical protein LUH19_08745, partial [Lachnospiraceae bacterium]|nr:hypothetical protein [Lachnospiraceae bacterium]